jgi:protein O-GlcNAc transferase
MVRLDLAKVLDEAGRRDEARREYETIISQQPDFTPALVGLGALNAKAGNLEAAADLFRCALAIDPTQADTRFNLARVLEQQKLSDEAAAEYRRLIEGESTPPAVREAAKQRLAVLLR